MHVAYNNTLGGAIYVKMYVAKITVTLKLGEFGVVYKAHIMRSEIVTETVAVKTLKGRHNTLSRSLSLSPLSLSLSLSYSYVHVLFSLTYNYRYH